MAQYRDELDDLFGLGANNVNLHEIKNSKGIKSKPGAFKKTLTKNKITKSKRNLIIFTAIAATLFAFHKHDQNTKIEKDNTNIAFALSEYRSNLDQAQRKTFDNNVLRGQSQEYITKDNFIQRDAGIKNSPHITKEVIESNILPTYIKEQKILNNIAKTTDFIVPENLKNNQVSSWIIKHIAEEKNLKEDFHSLLLATTMYREGFVDHIYNDVGYASVGPGQTVGVQSPSSVKERFSSIGMDEKRVNFFTGLSGKKINTIQLPNNYKDITISGKEGSMLALLHAEKDFIPSVKKSIGKNGFNLLLPQQQVALVGLSYQKGTIGETTSYAVKKHLDFREKNPGATTEKVIEHWAKNVSPTYSMSYTIIDKKGNKTKVVDTRAILLATMISDDIDGLQKMLTNTMTPREAKQYNIKLKEINSKLGNENNTDLISITNEGNISLYDPISSLKEQAASGDISLSVNKSESPIEHKKSGKIRLLR